MKLLLLSNSGDPKYEWCKDKIVNFSKGEEITFISAATLGSSQSYFEAARDKFKEFGLKLNHLILEDNPQALIEKTKVFFVGGGNTYNLLQQLCKFKLLEKLQEKIESGAKYIGASAGSNITGPNILTTNDWNIVRLKEFDSLNLVPFNINPHYIPPHDKKIFSGESRDERIFEYLAVNNNPVVALEERTYLEIDGSKIEIGGFGKIMVFEKNKKVKKFNSGGDLSFLLNL